MPFRSRFRNSSSVPLRSDPEGVAEAHVLTSRYDDSCAKPADKRRLVSQCYRFGGRVTGKTAACGPSVIFQLTPLDLWADILGAIADSSSWRAANPRGAQSLERGDTQNLLR